MREGSPRMGVARGSVAAQNSTDEEIIGERGKCSASMSPSTPNSTQGTRQVHTQGRKSDASGYVNWERQGEHGQPDDSDNEENVHSDTRLPKPLKVMPVLVATKMSLY
jgi:hypothetical protein